MRAFKSLIVIVTALSLPSCTAYLHEDHHGRRHCEEDRRPPCEYAHGHGRARRSGMIGIAIARAGESERGPIVIARVVPESPADDADLRPGDRIRGIDGESTRGMTLAEATRLIRGRADTAVELRLDSPHGSRVVTLVRVRAHAPCDKRGHGHHRCREGHDCRRRWEAPPAVEPPPATDESLAPELWPPTKPGHPL